MAGPGLGVGAAPARAVYSEAAAPGAEATRGMRSHAPHQATPPPSGHAPHQATPLSGSRLSAKPRPST